MQNELGDTEEEIGVAGDDELGEDGEKLPGALDSDDDGEADDEM